MHLVELMNVHVWCSVLQCVAVWCSVVQCVAVCCSVELINVYVRYRVAKTHRIPNLYSHFPQKSPLISGSEKDVQLKASYGSPLQGGEDS